jgi:hypothetical protein
MKKIIALGVSAMSVGALAFASVGPATAAEVPPANIVTAVCQALPASVTSLANQLLVAGSTSGIANADLLTKQAALGTAVTDLVNSVVSHLQTVNNGGNVQASAAVVNAKSSVFGDKIVAENNAMTSSFEAQRSAYLTGVSNNIVTGVQGLLCGP